MSPKIVYTLGHIEGDVRLELRVEIMTLIRACHVKVQYFVQECLCLITSSHPRMSAHLNNRSSKHVATTRDAVNQARRDGHMETFQHGDLLNGDNVSLECIINSM